MTIARRLFSPYVAFLSLTILISVLATYLAHSSQQTPIKVGASLDLTFTVTFLYYWLLVRNGLRSHKSMLFIALLGLWRASFLFPQVVPGKVWIGAGVEVAVFSAVGAGLWRSRKAVSNGDPIERLRNAFAGIVPVPAAARMMASECAVLYYAFAWRARPHVPSGAQAFTMHKRTMAGDLFYAMSLVSLIEIVPVHLLANRWSHVLAWTLTGISVYGAIWLIAMARAFHLRPSFVGPEGVTIRYGLLFQLQAAEFRVATEAPAGAWIVPRNTTASTYLEFAEPVTAELILGIPKTVTAIGISPDDAISFG
jgi:hypothetical protein